MASIIWGLTDLTLNRITYYCSHTVHMISRAVLSFSGRCIPVDFDPFLMTKTILKPFTLNLRYIFLIYVFQSAIAQFYLFCFRHQKWSDNINILRDWKILQNAVYIYSWCDVDNCLLLTEQTTNAFAFWYACSIYAYRTCIHCYRFVVSFSQFWTRKKEEYHWLIANAIGDFESMQAT